MSRPRLIFIVVVFSLTLGAFVAEHNREWNRPEGLPDGDVPAGELPALEMPLGQHSLSGRVLDHEGDPVEAVQVTLWRATAPEGLAELIPWAMSDADGVYHLDALPEGAWEIALLVPGYPIERLAVDVPVEGDQLDLFLQAPLPPLPSLPTMVRGALEGRLSPPVGFTPSESPLEGFEVVLRPADSNDPFTGAVVRRTTTNTIGHFRLEELVEADYLVEVLPPWAAGGSWPILDRFYLPYSAGPLNLVSLPLRLRCGQIAGRLADSDGRPLEGALISLAPKDEPQHPWPPRGTDAAGAFLIANLPPGDYELVYRAGQARWSGQAHVRVGARLELEAVTLDPGEIDD